ncbi:hypothetical protein M405DRAFT_862573 [Rhizopogon salebrosus TDB-379]|nr:hypothetical protein M405DRAFT_862573 [Rhizopogon salebrosus TDB-379]
MEIKPSIVHLMARESEGARSSTAPANLMVDTDNAKSNREFKKLSKNLGDKIDKEKDCAIESLEARDFKRNTSTNLICQPAIERLPAGRVCRCCLYRLFVRTNPDILMSHSRHDQHQKPIPTPTPYLLHANLTRPHFDELDVPNESYICFHRREIKAVRKTRASQATSSDKLLRLQSELTQGLELAKTLLSRENLKRDYTQQTLQVWDKRLEFIELKRKFPSLGTKEDEELLLNKERVVKKPKIETVHITGLKIHTRDRGDPGSPAMAVEASIQPKECLSLIDAAMERDLASQKERDHRYEDVVENPYQRPMFSFPQRHWNAIFPSLRSSTPSSDVADEEQESVTAMLHLIVELVCASVGGLIKTMSPPLNLRVLMSKIESLSMTTIQSTSVT